MTETKRIKVKPKILKVYEKLVADNSLPDPKKEWRVTLIHYSNFPQVLLDIREFVRDKSIKDFKTGKTKLYTGYTGRGMSFGIKRIKHLFGNMPTYIQDMENAQKKINKDRATKKAREVHQRHVSSEKEMGTLLSD